MQEILLSLPVGSCSSFDANTLFSFLWYFHLCTALEAYFLYTDLHIKIPEYRNIRGYCIQNTTIKTNTRHFFSHPDFTVGYGISPYQPISVFYQG